MGSPLTSAPPPAPACVPPPTPSPPLQTHHGAAGGCRAPQRAGRGGGAELSRGWAAGGARARLRTELVAAEGRREGRGGGKRGGAAGRGRCGDAARGPLPVRAWRRRAAPHELWGWPEKGRVCSSPPPTPPHHHHPITPSSTKIKQAGLPALGIYGGAQTRLAREAKGLWDAQIYPAWSPPAPQITRVRAAGEAAAFVILQGNSFPCGKAPQ